MITKQISKIIFEKIFIVSSTLLCCIALLEIGSRFLGRVPSNTTDGFFEQWGDSYRPQKNITKVIKWPSFSYSVHTNSLACRDKSVCCKNIDKKPYYAFLGASEVFGNGVNYEDSFVGIVAEHALEHGIECVNLAVGGHRLNDQTELFLDFLKQVNQKPLKVFFVINDRLIPLFDKKRENLMVKNGYLFNGKSWKKAYLRLILGNSSSAYCFFRDSIRKLQMKWIKSESDVSSDDFFHIYSKKNRMFNPDTMKLFENFLNNFKQYCINNSISPVYVYAPLVDSYRLNNLLEQFGKNPDDYDVSYYTKSLESYCKNQNIKFIDLRAVLQVNFDKGDQLRFKLDAHYNKLANRVIAQYLIENIF